MFVILRVSIDMETMEVTERVTRPYDGPWAYCKESDAQKQAQEQQKQWTDQLMQMYKIQFSEDQTMLSVITPQLEAMAANPEGFGATEYAALEAGIINTTGAQFSAASKEAATRFAVANEAGLPSGVEAQVQGELTGAAAGQVAAQSNALAIANEQQKIQQQQFALGELGGLYGQTGSFAQNTGGQVQTGIGSEFQQATQVYNQGSLWKNILGGVAGSALNAGTTFLGGAIPGQVGDIIGNIGV